MIKIGDKVTVGPENSDLLDLSRFPFVVGEIRECPEGSTGPCVDCPGVIMDTEGYRRGCFGYRGKYILKTVSGWDT